MWRAHHGHDENGNNPISLEQLLYNIAVDMDTSVQQLKLTYLYGTLNPDFHPQDRDVLPIAKGRDDPGTAKPIVRKQRYPMTPGSNHVEIAGSDPHSHGKQSYLHWMVHKAKAGGNNMMSHLWYQ